MQTNNNFRNKRKSSNNSNSSNNGNSIFDSYMSKESEKVIKTLEADLKNRFQNDYLLFEQQINLLKTENESLRKSYGELKERISKIRNYKTISIKVQHDNVMKDLGVQHFQFEKLLKYIQTKNNIFLVGPAGSGKTTAAQNIAKALDLKFYFTGAITSEFKLTGFIDAQGKTVSTDFRKAYEKGGVFLFDEIDASSPQAMLAFNAALANEFMDFPDGRVNKHKDFYCIAAANTYGTGADRQYVGRNQMDAASLDRFIFISWEIDEKLEHELAKHYEWTTYVQKVRKAVAKLSERMVVSPRASIKGSELLKIGTSREDVEQDVLWKGLDASRIQMIKNNIW